MDGWLCLLLFPAFPLLLAMASFTPVPSISTFSSTTHLLKELNFPILSKKFSLTTSRAIDNGAGMVGSVTLKERLEKKEDSSASPSPDLEGSTDTLNGKAKMVAKFEDPRWVGGTWDLNQFKRDGETHWDDVIDAEVKRRKWLQDNPEASSNDEPVVFDTSIIPWWPWVKRFHLPEAELLNGRAAMIGFFMAYLVDSLTGVGLVDQMGNFVCKLLLFVSVVGVLLIRKNEDVETLKTLIKETTFYDRQWQATWQDDSPSSFDKE